MRTALGIAATLLVGGGAVAAGATGTLTVPTTWYGSDTLQVVTWDVLGGNGNAGDTNLAPGQSPQYLSGGSGAGQSAMLTSLSPSAASVAHQWAAPMSKMMTNGVCGTTGTSVFGANNGTSAQNASGIVIGMDAVDIYSSTTSGGASACSTPNDGTNSLTSDGLVSSGSSSAIFGGGGTNSQNWKWALALLYGGLDYSSPASGTGFNLPDCNSTARRNLVANWSTLFQNNCGNGNAVCSDATHKALGAGGTATPLWHAFRRDDASGTSDVFSAILGIQGKGGGLSPSMTKLSGFGISPYCNVMNWDNTANNSGCSNTGGTNGHDQFLGPGGIPDPSSACTTTAWVSGTTSCGSAGTGNHRKPPTGSYGDQPSIAAAMEVLPTSFQDNDPIRRPCLGSATGTQAASAEEVCDTDNNLGVVLAIPSTDFISTTPGLSQYPTQPCYGPTAGPIQTSKLPQLHTCAISGAAKHGGECPNGDNTGATCYIPASSISQSQCLNNKTYRMPNNRAAAHNVDGRVYNLNMYDGDTNPQVTYISDTLINGTSPVIKLDLVGGMGRIHTISTVWNTGATVPVAPNVGCQMKDATDQIACLTQADPCSVGYAGDGGKTWYTRGSGDGNTGALCATDGLCTGGSADNTACSLNDVTVAACAAAGGTCTAGTKCTGGTDNGLTCSACIAGGGTCASYPAACNTAGPLVSESVRIHGTYPTATNVQALGSNNAEYEISRKLYYNSASGWANTNTYDVGEADFGAWESIASNTKAILGAVGYFTLGAGAPNGTETGTGYTKPFCEDFNQQTVCADAPTNDNACSRNGTVTIAGYPNAGLGYTTAIPSESAAASATPTQSTICGNGIDEAYEECDDGTANGTSGDKCSTTCRCAGSYTYQLISGTWQCAL
jgi:cysteine-rich repeat protein